MSLTEFEVLVERYLEGNISRVEEARLLKFIQESPELKNRFKAKVRLHEAQLECLAADKSKQAYLSFTWLRLFVNRMSQVASYACLVATVFVQLRVTLPAEYSGLLYHISERVSEDFEEMTENVTPDAMVANLEQDDLSDMSMPDSENNDILSPIDELESSEA